MTIAKTTDVVTLDASVYPYGAVQTLTNWGTLNVVNSPGGTNGLVMGSTPFTDTFLLQNPGTINIQNGAYLQLQSASTQAGVFTSYSNAINFAGNNSSLQFGGSSTTPTINGSTASPSIISFQDGTGQTIKGLDGNGAGGRITFQFGGNINASNSSLTIDNLDVNALTINATNNSNVTLTQDTSYNGGFNIDATSKVSVDGLWSGYNGSTQTLTQNVNVAGTLAIIGANIVTVNGSLGLSGAGQITDQNGNNALTGLQNITGTLSLSNGANFSPANVTTIGAVNLSGNSTLTLNTPGSFSFRAENVPLDYNYTTVIDSGSVLSLPNATQVTMPGGGTVSTPMNLVLQNGGTILAPNLTSISGESQVTISGTSLNWSSVTMDVGGLTVRNGSVTLNTVAALGTLAVGDVIAGLPGGILGTDNPATLISKGASADYVTIGPNATADLRGQPSPTSLREVRQAASRFTAAR